MLAPSVGIFAPAVSEGMLVSAGQVIGTLEVLGVRQSWSFPKASKAVSQRVGAARVRVCPCSMAMRARDFGRLAGGVAERADSRAACDTGGASFVRRADERPLLRPSISERAAVRLAG